MRLLHFDRQGTLVLTNFSENNLPQYAILSHRWSEEEAIFEDIQNRSYEKKKIGYQKIRFCAKQAARDSLDYFWIDTCCIDKYNTLELSTAINSMYSWYQRAAKCYAFLHDVSLPALARSEQERTWKEAFQASVWFTRGWTLQELLAPKSVEFFSKEGNRLGDKVSLERSICETTCLPAEALRGHPLESFSISERMKWAKTRTTTEPEDRVYCLLGILGVRITASYGEGEETALQRLLEELGSTSGSPSSIPFSRNPQFVGRQTELADLEAKLFQDQQTSVIAIIGAGGTGKSQLALELAHRTKQKDKSCSVFWLNASDPDRLYQDYTIIAQKLGIANWDRTDADLKLLVKLHLNQEKTRTWLLVFDNLELARVSTQASASLLEYLPRSERGSIVFTSTDRGTVQMLAKANIIELSEMTSDAAEEMLDAYLGTPGTANERQEKQLLLKELSYLPLAIVQAAAYIKLRNTTIHNYYTQLVRKRKECLKSEEDYIDSPVTTTLLISLGYIRQRHPLAANYFQLMACMDEKDILLDLLGTSLLQDKEGAIRLLSDYSLLTRRPSDSAVDMHQLLHHAMRKWLQKEDLLHSCTKSALLHLLEVFPQDDYGNRSKWRRFLPHAKYVLSANVIMQDDESRIELAYRCAKTLSSDGRWTEAQELEEQVLEKWRTTLGPEHPDTLTSMANLALTYLNQGRWKEAEELLVKVIETETRRTVLGPEHPSTLTSMANLASTYRNQGRWKEAEELEVKVIETRRTVLGPEHPSTLTSMANLASTYWNQGRWKEAEELEVKVIETWRTVLGPEHPSTLTSMANLASTYLNQGRMQEAQDLVTGCLEA